MFLIFLIVAGAAEHDELDTVLATWSVHLRFLLDPHTKELVGGDSF